MPTNRKALLEKARKREVQANRLEVQGRKMLAKASALRDQARTLRQCADGQETLPLAPPRRKRLLLRTEVFLKVMREAGLKHREFAEQLGIASCTWSQILNRQRGASPQMQTRLLNHPLIAGRSETTLWELEP